MRYPDRAFRSARQLCTAPCRWCEAETIKRGGKAYTWRHWRAGGCVIYGDYCTKPVARCNGCWKFKVYSLHTPVAAMFFKLGGGYVGGPVTSTWSPAPQPTRREREGRREITCVDSKNAFFSRSWRNVLGEIRIPVANKSRLRKA